MKRIIIVYLSILILVLFTISTVVSTNNNNSNNNDESSTLYKDNNNDDKIKHININNQNNQDSNNNNNNIEDGSYSYSSDDSFSFSSSTELIDVGYGFSSSEDGNDPSRWDSFSESASSDSWYGSSMNSYGEPLLDCPPYPYNASAPIKRGDLERGWNISWSEETNVIQSPPQYNYDAQVGSMAPYEGSNFAQFKQIGDILESLPIPFPDLESIVNYSDPSTFLEYSQLFLQFYVRIIPNTNVNSSRVRGERDGSTGTPSPTPTPPQPLNDGIVIVTLDEEVIFTINVNASQQSPTPTYSPYQYYQFMINVTQFADSKERILAFQYNSSTGVGSEYHYNSHEEERVSIQQQNTIYLIDYIQFTPRPLTLLNQDVYISFNGSDVTGNGSITQPFCSIQRAINSIESGNSIIVLTDINYGIHFPDTSYGIDALGKTLLVKSYMTTDGYPNLKSLHDDELDRKYSNMVSQKSNLGADHQLLQTTNYTEGKPSKWGYRLLWDNTELMPLLIASSSNFTVLNVVFYGSPSSLNPGQSSTFTVPCGSNFTLLNSVIEYGNTNDINVDNIGFAFDTHLLSNLYINNSVFRAIEAYGALISSRGQSIIFNQSLVYNVASYQFMILSKDTDLTVTGCKFVEAQNIFNMTSFGTVTLENNVFYNSQSQQTSQDTITNGKMFSLSNNYFLGCQQSWSFIVVDTVRFSKVTLNAMSISTDYGFYFERISTVVSIDDTYIGNSTSGIQPMFDIHMLSDNQFFFTNSLINNMSLPLFDLYYTFAVLENVTFIFNSLPTSLITATNSVFEMHNVNAINNEGPFISATSSQMTYTDSLLTNGYNSHDLPVNLISISSPVKQTDSTILENLTFENNFNFILVEVDNNLKQDGFVIMNNVYFYNNNIGDLINTYVAKVQICNVTAVDNFLGAFYYPLNIWNTSLEVINSTFNRNSQYLSLRMSTFNFTNTSWKKINAMANSFYIDESTGVFRSSFIGDCYPNIGMMITRSNLTYTNVQFTTLSGYDTPLGYYNFSTVLFNDCQFSGCMSGHHMMLSITSNITFKFCDFQTMFSPVTNIIFAQHSHITFQQVFIENTQANQFGIVAKHSKLNILSCLFEQNIAHNLIATSNSDFLIFDTTFRANQMMIDLEASAGIINNCTFNFNIPPASTILIKALASNLNLTASYFSQNGNDLTYSLISAPSGSILTVSGCKFQGHYLPNANGTIINSMLSSVFVSNSQFITGSSAFGAIYSVNSKIALDKTETNFFTSLSGSVIYSTGCNISITGSVMANNYADKPIGMNNNQPEIGAGGCYTLLGNSKLNISNSVHTMNIANENGGVIYLDPSSVTHISSSQWTDNTARFGAGGVCYSSQHPNCNFDNTNTFGGNTATYGTIFASGPKSFNITVLDLNSVNISHVHPNTPFTLVASLFDIYGQTVNVLRQPTNFNITIFNEPYSYIMTYTSINTMQGFMDQPVVVYGDIGSYYYVIASTSIGFNSTTSLQILQCDPGYFADAPNWECETCPPNKFGWDGETCYDCTTGDLANQVMCPGGPEIITKAGYWMLPNVYPPEIYECDQDICLVGECRPHQTGILCSKCDEGYTKVQLFCEECHSFNPFILLGLVAFFFCYLLMMTTFRVPSGTIILNLLICLQSIGVLVYNVRYVAIVSLFDFVLDYWPSTCLYPGLTYLLKATISIIIMLVVIVLSTNLTWGKNIVWRFLPKLINLVNETFDKSIKYSLFSHVLTLYTPLAFLSLSMVSCYKIGDEYYLTMDASVQCFTTYHYPLFALSALVILFVVIGIPLTIFIQIRRKNKYFNKIFFDKYKPKAKWWDIILLMRSLCFIITTISTVYHSDAKALITSTLGLFFTCLTWFVSPYRNKSHTEFETHLGLTLCFVTLMINSRAFNNGIIVTGVLISGISLLPFIALLYCIKKLTIKKLSTADSLEKDWGIVKNSNN